MCQRFLRFTFAVSVVAASVAATGSHLPAADLRIAEDASTISVLDGNRLVLRYRCTNVAKKPYADQFVSPAGVQVLRDSPSDHKHHHGLMYAMVVDGVNFWEEHLANSGKQVQRSLADAKAAVCDGIGRAGFVQELDWVGTASNKPLMVERRAIDVFTGGDLGATLIQWQCRLQTPPGKESIVLGGNPYHGLGMRFLPSMDTGGRFFNSDGNSGEVISGDLRLTPAKWCAYTAKADGKPVTVAIFDHPTNLRYPAKFFTMTQPFAYLSATLNTAKEPITVKTGKPLDLCYGVALWDGQVDRATVEKLYQRWLVLSVTSAG